MEILVVIGIIAVLAGITTASMTGARENSRDSARIADLGQIALGFKLYANKNAAYPARVDPVEINSDNALEAELLQHIPTLPEGEFYYDSEYNCGGRTVPIVYATLENDQRSNLEKVCGGSPGGIYIIILE